ncbi:A disintegrin and metalloproteinase with thrombospondin motifs 3-like isoform X2 [Aricia agestis]|uniref:A disintegrin and metalloproteinase with thrombospondin motifs 3-like isoform X2 n=1 Tax=Aricia agestis TaxID=91739 RepID=UPI001C209EB5|nr:A disintegrin and metalloproteinase with thrombospondin motifs 3-like isoform X2 [Aricia agestis]
MRERSAACARAGPGPRARAGRLLEAALLLALLAPHAAWTPPADPVLFDVSPARSRSPRHAPGAIRHLHVLRWHLELQENRAIRSPYYDECQFYTGRVLHEEDSTVTVTECAGRLYGLLQVAGEDYVVQPTRPEGRHVLRRRDVRVADQPVAYNLTDDTVDDLEIDFDDERPSPVPFVHRRSGDESESENEYFRGVQTVTRPVTGVRGLWLELAIVADYTILKFHGRERVEHYILAIMNIVSAIFNDRSLDSNMTLVINKLFLYEERDSVIRNGNVQKSLESVNKWNYKHLMKLPPGSTGWDATVWLTRSRLGGPSGYAPVGGVCTRTRSAAIGRDEGLTSAFVLAHEIAHLLGVKHDGPGRCEADSTRGSVMASTVLATLHNYAWSACSRQQFHEKAEKLWCLHERSQDEGVVLGGSKALSNYVFTMDEQCRTEFGEGYSVCKSVNLSSPCAGLYCAHRDLPSVCRSKRAPPLEGTPCGHNRWCVDRVCEVMPGRRAEHRVDARPQWGEWGEWSPCDAHCGYGLRTRSRRCRYRGSTSATACEGAGSQVATCWSGVPCPAGRDARTDACYRRARTYVPHIPEEESRSCELWCTHYDGGEPANFGYLPDGVTCNYTRPYDLCYQGTCVRGQCNSTDPACNWCPDGYCNNHTQINQRQLGKGWTRLTLIPREANQISVHISTPILLNLAIREMKRERPTIELFKHSRRSELENSQDNYLKYDPSVPQNLQIIEVDSNVIDIKEDRYMWEGQVVAAGSLIHWKLTDTDVSVTSSSRLQNDLMIMAIANQSVGDEPILLEVSVNYSTPAGRTRPMEYKWFVERGPCSVSCGGGLRKVRPRCGRDQQCGPTTYERCNMHSCHFTWATGEWEECSATCGDGGVQERQLYCVPDNISIRKHELIRRSVSPALCPGRRPDRQQRCNRVPCPVYWQELPWTQCSATCGRGVSYRPLVCPGGDDLLCGPKPRERRRRCRLRRCPSRRAPECPNKDGTQYCELFTREQLERNCLLPPFRSYCCNTCKAVHIINGVP